MRCFAEEAKVLDREWKDTFFLFNKLERITLRLNQVIQASGLDSFSQMTDCFFQPITLVTLSPCDLQVCHV